VDSRPQELAAGGPVLTSCGPFTAIRVLAFALVCVGASAGLAAPPVEQSCDAAAAKAERTWNVPAGVLGAVGTVESGRPSSLGAAPWPWTINAAGRGAFFESKDAAIAAVLTLMERGYPFIDIGCFQVDIAYHAGVFRSLDDAFDPEKNAQAAAQILAAERAISPDWATAVARYHSATPMYGIPYLQRVRAALPAAQRRVAAASFDAAFPTLFQGSGTHTGVLPQVVYPPPLARGHPPQIVVMPAPATPPHATLVEASSATENQ
jgi:hypothetical protein